jgi:hypothetical protein
MTKLSVKSRGRIAEIEVRMGSHLPMTGQHFTYFGWAALKPV